MLNGGGSGRLEAWPNKGPQEIMCIFLAERKDDEEILRKLIRNVPEVDRVLGSKIGFLVLFNSISQDDKKDSSDFRPLADILVHYETENIIRDHLSIDIVETTRNRFGVPLDALPAILVFVRGLPEEPFIYSLPVPTSYEFLLSWFSGLKKIAEEIENLQIPAVGNRLAESINSAEKISAKAVEPSKKFSDILTHLSNKYHLIRDHQWMLAYLPKDQGTLSQSLQLALAKIDDERRSLEKPPFSTDRQFSKVFKLAGQIDRYHQEKLDILLAAAAGNMGNLNDLQKTEKEKYQSILLAIEQFSRDTRIKSKAGFVSKSLKNSGVNLSSYIDWLGKLIKRAQELAGYL